MFHPRCGARIRLSADQRTATRSPSEFNYGLVFSREPLVDEELFEIRIDKKTYSWIGSLEVGVTTCDPENLNLPGSATDLRSGTWILSGKSVLKDGRTLMETYPLNLDKIVEGERIGVLRTSSGELEFFVNGISHGVAATDLPLKVFALVDVYGKVSQVSIMSRPAGSGDDCNSRASDLSIPELVSSDMSSSTTSNYRGGGSGGFGDDTGQMQQHNLQPHNLTSPPPGVPTATSGQSGGERLRFHERTGSLQVKLSCHGRAAERMRPLDEFNNAVVMTHRPLVSDTMFEIRIDRLVKKWSGSIEVGVTTHDPSQLEFPATMTNMRSGTVMMSGCGILTNGKGTKREYGEYNLDELRVGDRIGMMRKNNGDLHYFINGLDQGVAASRVPDSVWGVVDLYGMTVKVTIVDRDEREEQNLITRRNTVLRENVMQSLTDVSDDDVEDRLLFHPNCGSHAAVINNGRTAHRPNSLDDFNNAVVLTNRPLKPNEVFEVRIDKMVTKWAGSIEVGVTTHAPNELEYPSTMTNVRSGTWIMTGNGVMHNGTSVIDDYGQNLDRLQTGSRVGVVIREGGSLHFLVNGEDQGEAGVGLPPRLYAVIDLYGQATQASIVSHCPSCSPTAPLPPASSPFSSEVHFHSVHGRNARVTNGGKTASRPRATVEFNDAIVVTNRPLRPGEMFSVIVERIVDRWSGSIEAGVTAIRPDELELPGTMTDLDHDTWMLSGFAVMKDGVTLRQGYPLDLDNVGVGSVVGMKLHEGGSLHYYLDGIDQGVACSGLPEVVYPVIDLYGQCAQVSIVSSLEPVMEIDESTCHQLPSHSPSDTTVLPNHQQLLHKLHALYGMAVTMDERLTSATRSCLVPCGGLVYSAVPLAPSELFEVALEGYAPQWAGALAIGVFGGPEPQDKSRVPLQLTALRENICYILGSDIFQNGELVRRNYCPSLEWLRPPARVGVKRSFDATLHIYIDGVDQGVAAHNIPKKVYAVVDMYGSTCSVRVISKAGVANQVEAPFLQPMPEAETVCDKDLEGASGEGKKNEDMEKSIEDGDLISEIHDVDGYGDLHVFHELHGRNVQVSENRLAAKRVASYNQGLVLVNNHASRKGHLFQICIESLNTRWVSSLSIGITSPGIVSSTLPVTALGLKKDAWIISGDCVYHNGYKVKSKYGPNLDILGIGSLVGILVDEENNLKLFVNGVDHGVAAANIPKAWIPVLDLYGMCDQVSIVNPNVELGALAPSTSEAASIMLMMSSGASSCGGGTKVRHDWAEAEKGDAEGKEKQTEMGATCSTSSGSGNNGGGVDAARTKSDKMNENIQCCSSLSGVVNGVNTTVVAATVHSPTNAVGGGAHEAKAIASTENLTLQMFEQQQNAERRAANEEKASTGSGTYLKSPTVAVRSIGSSLAVTPISPVNVVKPPTCDYLSSVLRLKAFLGLPNGFFRKDGSVTCYCTMCCSSGWRQQQGGGGVNKCLGESPPPLGWARLPLRNRLASPPNKGAGVAAPGSPATGGQAVTPGATDQWHVAFVATTLGTVRRILDVGELMTPGELGLGQDLTGGESRDKKHDESDSNLIVLWPTLQSATVASYSPKHQYVDPKTKQPMVAYAALQVLVRPGSYKVGEGPRSPPPQQHQAPPTIEEAPVTTTVLVVGGTPPLEDGLTHICGAGGGSIDAAVPPTATVPASTNAPITEWVTKEKNATVLTALLLRLEPI